MPDVPPGALRGEENASEDWEGPYPLHSEGLDTVRRGSEIGRERKGTYDSVCPLIISGDRASVHGCGKELANNPAHVDKCR